ncbi:hypothetical protein LCGC14_1956920, partial [marine sediment metagenome]
GAFQHVDTGFDVIFADTTGSPTFWLWKDDDTQKLFIGSPQAIPNFRADLIFDSDNTNDIGASGANRPRDLYVADQGVFGGGVTIGGGTEIIGHLSATASLNFDFSGAGITEQDLTITVTGAGVGDTCVVGLPTALQVTGLTFTCFVSATNTVTVRGMDVTSSGPDPAAATVRVDTWQH